MKDATISTVLPEEQIIERKQAGIVLIIFGVMLLAIILNYTITRGDRIKGLAELLPRDETILYMEGPVALPPALTNYFKSNLDLVWDRQVVPWAQGKTALALIKEKNAQTIMSFVLIETSSPQDALHTLTLYKNPLEKVSEISVSGTRIFSTPTIHFAFWQNAVIISKSRESLTYLVQKQSLLEPKIAADKNFITVRGQTPGDFFIYIKSRNLPQSLLFNLQTFFAHVPPLLTPFEEMGIGLDYSKNTWRGRSFALIKAPLTTHKQHAYRALLLSLLPPDFDILLSGNEFPLYLGKIQALMPQTPASALASVGVLEKVFADLSPLLSKEYAMVIGGEDVLLISEVGREDREGVEIAVKKIIEREATFLSEKIQMVTLPDGTQAQERFPAPENVETVSERFKNDMIEGRRAKDTGKALYFAFAHEKLFISNRLDRLGNALSLTEVVGKNFRDTPLYRTSLQPILKNPELLGVARLNGSIFSFSKQIFTDHMEVNFILMLE